jgi:hypothetical protein
MHANEYGPGRKLPEPRLTALANGTRDWRVGAVLHREDGPARERADGSWEWWLRGERHRTDGPAAESAEGRFWWQHGNLHREGGPAVERADGSREWYRSGLRHREEGPAVEAANGTSEWWFQGRPMSEEEHRVLTSRRRPRPRMKLWLLAPRGDVLRRKMNPWRPWYEKVFAAVVRAESEQQAREFVQQTAGHEGLGIYRALGMDEEEVALTVWLDDEFTRCRELRPGGGEGIVVLDRREA